MARAWGTTRGRTTNGTGWPRSSPTSPTGRATGHDEEPHPLLLDGSRMSEADEAWVPVLTPDGPGVLVWSNSD
ncbi:DUF6210 family protein [Saccharothrix sp. Mg75]|uniref:DUF6210 family protein n=1 Tax=Saccharothrix sp. Mg75 TaxID=3445357 RepID=UPI003EEA12C9